jgi:HK97 gp10 family phage protein
MEADMSELLNLSVSLAAASIPATDRVLARGAAQITATAKQIAPVDTGYMRSSITPKRVNHMEHAIISQANYSGFVENGTVHMRPRPFMRPALDKHLPGIADALADAAVRIF